MVQAKFFEKGKEHSKGAKAPKTSLHLAAQLEEGRSSPDTALEVKPESSEPSPKNENPIMAWAKSFYAPATKGGKSRRQHKRKTRRTRKHRK
jgi:hypothetical protein